MSKLISADFARLWKNKLFWAEAALMFLWAVVVLVTSYRNGIKYDYTDMMVLDEFFFQQAPLIGGFCAVFTSLFLGTDYSDGTIRNKIMIGHDRKAVYLSALIVSAAAGIIINMVWVLGMLVIGIPLFGWIKAGTAVIAIHFLILLLLIISITSIFTLIGMLNHRKAGAAVISLLVFLMLLFLAAWCNQKLSEPEIYEGGYAILEDGTFEEIEPYPNPYYISGNTRKAFTFALEFQPEGQGLLVGNMEVENQWRLMLYSIVVTAVTTVAGIYSFQRKNIN